MALYKGVAELGREPGLHALGELVKVDKENAQVQLQTHPNEKQGNLYKPFRLPLVAGLALLEGLPELSSGLEVWGELKHIRGGWCDQGAGRTTATQACGCRSASRLKAKGDKKRVMCRPTTVPIF